MEVVLCMGKIAVDVVLLPCEEMAEKAIEANRRLVETGNEQIILNKQNCLPHISLAMGCIEKKDIDEIEKILQAVAKKSFPKILRIVGVYTGVNAAGQKVSVYHVGNTEALQHLHEKVMGSLESYFTYDVTEKMFAGQESVEENSVLWVKSFRQKSSFEKFFPHITIGYGQADAGVLPIEFTVSKLALCHLGNHCTCRRILASIAHSS